MKKTLLLLLSAFSMLAHAQENNSILWQISGNGLKQPSYLFGTIHMIPKKDYFFTPKMNEVFLSCNALLIEADMFSIGLSEQIDLAKRAFLPESKTLQDYMDSLEYLQFKQVMKDSLGIKEKKIDGSYGRIKPFFLSALLLQKYVGKTKTYEQELYNYSKKNKMELLALETIDFQMSLADSLSIEEQIDGLGDMKEYHKYFEMVTLYKQQNINGLYDMGIEEFQTQAELKFMALFLTDRNRDWIPKIENFAKEKSCFIAVGALHLTGETGVIELLRKEGYTVEPVVSN